jgi:hypothetical protein
VRAGLLLLAVLALAGCAERWAKPGATEAEFRAMEAQCTAQANDRWPPMLRQEIVMPARFVPPVRSCDRHGRCSWYGGWWEPPVMGVVDDHAAPRHQERRACYMANGWMPVED